MSEVIVKDDRRVICVADGEKCSTVTFYKTGSTVLSSRQIEIESGD
jgi:hypothetical protein